MTDTAIRVSHLNKMYKLYDKPVDRLKETLGFRKKKRYKEHYALNDVSLEVGKGECVGIIGTNGAGKSTLLKVITGVLTPTSGELEINGRISALLELGAGFNMEYTGLQNVYLNGMMIGFSKAEIDSRLQDILDFADIGDFINQPVKMYSSGMFVRLAFAVAINIDPEILIVDEALSVGDVFFQAKCYHKFEDFKRAGKTIIFVSHDLSSIQKYCDRAILLDHGNKIKEGTPKDIIDIYKKIIVNQYNPEEDDLPAMEVDPPVKGDAPSKDAMFVNPDMIEYGNGSAYITDFCIIDEKGLVSGTIEKGSQFTLQFTVEFNKRVVDPILAFTIKDLKGTDITGTNTSYEGIELGALEPGTKKTIRFKQQMLLQGGEYLVSLGCTGFENGEFTVYHRLYDLFSLTVISTQNTVGFYDMNSAVELGDD